MNTEQERVNNTAVVQPGPAAPQVAPGPVNQPDRPAPATVNSKAPRRSGNRTSASATVHPLLHGVANVPFYANQGGVSTFVPDATAAYNALENMDMHMCTIRRFYENCPMWCPLLSQAYLGVIWTIQILRNSQSAGMLTQEQSEVLTWFEGMYPYQNLAVPGPLVPFFQSIGVCAGPVDSYGDVTPVLNNVSDVRANYWFLTHGVQRLFPPVHLFVDQMRYLQEVPANVRDHAGTHPVRIYVNVFGNAVPAPGAALNAQMAFMGYAPGVANRWHISSTHIQAWIYNSNSLGLPPRMITGAVPNPNPHGHVQGPANGLALGEYLRLATQGQMHPGWFTNAVSIMQRYSQFFSGSTTMAGINTAGFGASIPIWRPLAQTQRLQGRPAHQNGATQQDATAYNYLTWNIATNQAASGHLVDFTMMPNYDGSDPHLRARQYSAVTQVNTSHDIGHAGGNAFNDYPANATIRHGPIWRLIEMAQSPGVDNTIVIPQNILGMFVADTRLNH